MKTTVEAELKIFANILDNWGKSPGKIEKKADFAYVWHSPHARPLISGKSVHLTFQAITHGNEVGGIKVLQSVIELIKNEVVRPDISIGFVLGNINAALENRRFILQDLNRAFGRSQVACDEDKRARELEPLLSESRYFLDFHQTIEPTLKPFFIFPYQDSCFDFAQSLRANIPIVTHWGNSFSKDGMCSDEFVNHAGGVGITIELGQKKFDVYQTGIGLQVALAAISYVQARTKNEVVIWGDREQSELFTWRQVVSYEAGMCLNEGLVNFQSLKAGDIIGSARNGPLLVPFDGWLLFPKYQRDPEAPAPKEIFRIMKKISPQQLGLEGVIGS